MLFSDEKLGQVVLQLSESERGFQTNWLQLMSPKDEAIGKILVHIDIKPDNTSKQLRMIQKDLSMQDQVPREEQRPSAPGMNLDLTEDRGMPLRNHEQVLLLNERINSSIHSNLPPQPQPYQNHVAQTSSITQIINPHVPQNESTNNSGAQTQVTHITHQTQNSALIMGGSLQPAPLKKVPLRITKVAKRKPRAGASIATNQAHLDTSMGRGIAEKSRVLGRFDYGQEYDPEDDEEYGEYGDSEPASDYDDEDAYVEEDSYGEPEPRVEPQVVDTGGNLQTLCDDKDELDDDDYGDELDLNQVEPQ